MSARLAKLDQLARMRAAAALGVSQNEEAGNSFSGSTNSRGRTNFFARASSSCDDCDSSEEDEDAWVETAGQACQLRAGGQSWGATTVMGPDGSLVHEAGTWLARLDAAHNKRRRRRRRVRHARAAAASPWSHPNRLRGRGALGARGAAARGALGAA